MLFNVYSLQLVIEEVRIHWSLTPVGNYYKHYIHLFQQIFLLYIDYIHIYVMNNRIILLYILNRILYSHRLYKLIP